MKVKTQNFVRPLRSASSKQQNMKFSGPPPEKVPKMAPQIEDLSLLKKSVDTSVTNPLEILKVFQGGSPEAIETMKNECSLIYECKVCRNLFRSIANFIIHKRNYCTTKFSMPDQSGLNGDILNHSLIVGTMRGTVSSSRKTTRRDILSLLDNLQERIPEVKPHVFTEIPHTGAAVYNTTNTSPVKGESSNGTVVLGPRGQIIGSTRDNGLTIECKSCGETVTHMESHLSICNSVFKQCFGCPLCEKYFTTPWAVYRHLRKIHGKNPEQVRKLRGLIRKQEIPVETKYKKQAVVTTSAASSSADKGWLEELEKNGADGLYKCYICGKQFERRVALLSHTQACEKRKPGEKSTDIKKPQTLSKEQTDKPHPAAIQMKICYKKEGLDKLTDCRVVATRLTDEDTLAALSPNSKESECSHNDNRNSASLSTCVSLEDLSQIDQNNDEPIQVDIEEVRHESNLKGETNVFFPEDTALVIIGDPDNLVNGEVNGDFSDYRDNPTQDMLVSQASLEDISRDSDAVIPTVSQHNVEAESELPMTNGYLSSADETNQHVGCPSPEKPCNGWTEPEADTTKNHFYSAFVESAESNESHCCEDSFLSNEEEGIEDCDLDSLDVTRIICGSVKVERRISEDDMVQEDQNDHASGKRALSVSTDVSFDFEMVENEMELSDNEGDETSISLDAYISKTDSVCLICYQKITDTRYASTHVADHLGIVRFACKVPSCPVKTYSQFEVIDHIRNDHMLESASLIRTLKPEEMFADAKIDFPGFSASHEAMASSYSEFFGVLFNRHGITFEDL